MGDTQSPGGGCELSSVTRVRSAWGQFRELLPLLTSLTTRGHLYNTYVCNVILHASECWAPTVTDVARLQRSDRSTIRWICGVKWDDYVSSDSLLKRLGIHSLTDLLRCHRLQWYGHVQEGYFEHGGSRKYPWSREAKENLDGVCQERHQDMEHACQ